MIQRIQTLYFLAAMALAIWCSCVNVGRYVLQSGEHILWGNGSFWPLMVLLVAVALLQIPAIMLYKHRLLQVRIGIFSALLLCGWYVLFFWHGYYAHSVLDAAENYVADLRFVPLWTASLPAVAAIFMVMAVRAVLQDERKVHAYERLR